jgi:hypothetical protein
VRCVASTSSRMPTACAAASVRQHRGSSFHQTAYAPCICGWLLLLAHPLSDLFGSQRTHAPCICGLLLLPTHPICQDSCCLEHKLKSSGLGTACHRGH